MQCLASHLNSVINTTSNKLGRHKASCHFHGYGIDLRIPGIPIHACKSTNLAICYVTTSIYGFRKLPLLSLSYNYI